MPEEGSYRFGNTTIHYGVTRSRRRKKTIEITVDPFEGVLVAAPVAASLEHIRSVIEKRAGWIIRKSNNSDFKPRPRRFMSGESVPYLGREVRMLVEATDKNRASVKFDHWSFRVQSPAAIDNEEDRRGRIRSALENWYRQRAAERLPAAVMRWTQRLGVEPTGVFIRDQKHRWGSCSTDGTLRFNWRVVMADPALIDYVVVHEMLHLKALNHSRSYWRNFARVMPDYEVRRRQLREIGPYLSI